MVNKKKIFKYMFLWFEVVISIPTGIYWFISSTILISQIGSVILFLLGALIMIGLLTGAYKEW